MVATPKVRYTLVPNQYVGVWETGFMPQWIGREYLARRGSAPFRPHQLTPARCPLLGYAFASMQIEGTLLPQWLLQVDRQPEVTPEGYDAGAALFQKFFKRELDKFIHPDIDPLGRDVITCCMDNGSIEDYQKLMRTVAE